MAGFRPLRLTLVLFLFLVAGFAAEAENFSVVNGEGDTIYYTITSVSPATVGVTYRGYYYSNYQDEYSGAITIPRRVRYNGVVYSVTSIENQAFSGCVNLRSVTIPSSVTSIGAGAFSGCSSLRSVTLPSSVSSIGFSAFSGCSSLVSIAIPPAVTAIGFGTFNGCSSLDSVSIPSSVTSIGFDAFSGCSSLVSITVPSSVTSIGFNAFSSVRHIRYDGTAYGATWGALSMNGYVEGCLVYSDSTKTYLLGCSVAATSVDIPSSVATIGDAAFKGCSRLTAVTIPSSVVSIGNRAFYGCSSLSSVTIPPSVTEIGHFAFYDCGSLASVAIPPTVSSIGYAAFYGVLHIEYQGMAIGAPWNALFMNSFVEGDLVYSDSTKSHLLHCSPAATSVNIPPSVLSIGNSAFYGCRNLTSVAIPSSVTTIGNNAFSGCSNLVSVAIPSSVTMIGDNAFANCSSLTSISIPSSVTSIGERAFYYCNNLAFVAMSSSVSSIGMEAFSGCGRLASVSLPSSVTSIGDRAFANCYSITSLTIPSSVETMGNKAFAGCTALDTVIIESSCFLPENLFLSYENFSIDCLIIHSMPPSGEVVAESMYGITDYTDIYVPCAVMDSYRNHSFWGAYRNYRSNSICDNEETSKSIASIEKENTETSGEDEEAAAVHYADRADERVTLQVEPLPSDAQVTLFDAQGRTIFSQTLMAGKEEFTLNIRRLAAGNYHLRIECGDQTIIRKLVLR